MFRIASARLLVLPAVAAALFAPAVIAASNTVTVQGVSDIWLAGQPNAASLLATSYGTADTAPTNSPVLASTGLNLTAGSYLTFSATGFTNFGGCASPSPDGAGTCGTFNSTAETGSWGTGAANNISTFIGPVNAVVGVFVSTAPPSGTLPAGLDFTLAGAQSQTTISPLLNQVFFIGDGLTGTGSGSVQHFIIPAGATRLYLASSDGVGLSFNNSSSFSVTVSDSATSVPAVSPLVLLSMALLLAVGGAYLLKGRTSAA